MVLSTSSEDEARPPPRPVARPKPRPSLGAGLTAGRTIVTAEALLADKPKAVGLSGAELRRRRDEKRRAGAEARRRSAAGAPAAPAHARPKPKKKKGVLSDSDSSDGGRPPPPKKARAPDFDDDAPSKPRAPPSKRKKAHPAPGDGASSSEDDVRPPRPAPTRKERPKKRRAPRPPTPPPDLDALLGGGEVCNNDSDDSMGGGFDPWAAQKAKEARTKAPKPKGPAGERKPRAGGKKTAHVADASASGSESDGPMPDPASDAFRVKFFDEPQRGDLVLEGDGAQCGGGNVTCPGTIHRYLFPYQVEGMQWLWRQASSGRGGILADDMGLGKTLQTVAFFAALLGCTGSRRKDGQRARARRRKARRNEAPDADFKVALVLAPTSLLEGWKRELNKFTLLNVCVAKTGSEAAQAALDAKNGATDVLVTTHSLAKNLTESGPDRWACVIVDEAHGYKNPASKRYEEMRSIQSRADVLFGLTGTPLQNNMEELHALLSLCTDAVLGSKGDFKETYENTIARGQEAGASRNQRSNATDRRKQLQRITSRYILRRTKEEELSEQLKAGKEEKIVMCTLSPLQARLYRNVVESPDVDCLKRAKEPCDCGREGEKRGKCCHRADMLPRLLGGDFASKCYFASSCKNGDGLPCEKCPQCYTFSVMSKLSKIANHPELIKLDAKHKDDQQKVEVARRFCTLAHGVEPSSCIRTTRWKDLRDETQAGKLGALHGLLDRFDRESPPAKVLIFSASTQTLDILEGTFKTVYPSSVRIDGATAGAQRQKNVDKFNTDDQIFLAYISTKAGGTGLNLQAANRVVIFDVNWNPTFDAQAQDRAFRLGQLRQVRVYKLVSRGTIEELTLMRQLYKNKVTGSAIEAKKKAKSKEYEDRRFKGVKGKRDGELFGLGNLLKYSEDTSFLNDILEAEGDEIDEEALASNLDAKKDQVAELVGIEEEAEAEEEAEVVQRKRGAKGEEDAAPASSRKHSAKAPKAAADDEEAEEAAPAPAPVKRASTSAAPWGKVRGPDEAGPTVSGDDWDASDSDDGLSVLCTDYITNI